MYSCWLWPYVGVFIWRGSAPHLSLVPWLSLRCQLPSYWHDHLQPNLHVPPSIWPGNTSHFCLKFLLIVTTSAAYGQPTRVTLHRSPSRKRTSGRYCFTLSLELSLELLLTVAKRINWISGLDHGIENSEEVHQDRYFRVKESERWRATAE